MKRRVTFGFVCLSLIFILSLSVISAFSFSNVWKKISGNVVESSPECTNFVENFIRLGCSEPDINLESIIYNKEDKELKAQNCNALIKNFIKAGCDQSVMGGKFGRVGEAKGGGEIGQCQKKSFCGTYDNFETNDLSNWIYTTGAGIFNINNGMLEIIPEHTLSTWDNILGSSCFITPKESDQISYEVDLKVDYGSNFHVAGFGNPLTQISEMVLIACNQEGVFGPGKDCIVIAHLGLNNGQTSKYVLGTASYGETIHAKLVYDKNSGLGSAYVGNFNPVSANIGAGNLNLSLLFIQSVFPNTWTPDETNGKVDNVYFCNKKVGLFASIIGSSV